MIKLDDVVKQYKVGDSFVSASDHISFEIPDSTFVSISGKSGSGKTTLLNLIGGKEIPDSGKILIDGVDINRLSDREQSKFRNENIGYVFQSFLLEPSMTALENVELPLIIRKYSKEKRRQIAREMLEKVGLENRLFHKPSQMSGGEQQRVSIARALCTAPKILLADEPTGNLDEKTGESIINLMKELTKDRTLILVTHDEELARSTPMQIILVDGRIQTLIDERTLI